MKKLIIITVCLVAQFLKAQAQFPKDSVFDSKGDGLGFYIENGKYFLKFLGQIGSPQSTFTFYKDTVPIKTSIPTFGVLSYHYDPIKKTFVIITFGSNARLISINFYTNTYYEQTFENHFGEVIYNGKAYFSVTEEDKIIIVDINTGDQKIIPIRKSFSLNENSKPLFIAKLSSDSILINTGFWRGDELRELQYFLVNEHNLNYREYLPVDDLRLVFNEHGSRLLYYDIPKKFAFCRNGILDSKHQFFSGFLNQFELVITDFVIKENEIIQLLVSSPLDEPVSRWNSNRQRVRIPYVPCPHRERVMFMIYHNELLSYDDLVRFDAHDLRLMRNMVFAKYNYDFSATFLKAYFNLYDFYRNGRNNRIRDVNHLLTEADKANIALIRAAEARVKE